MLLTEHNLCKIDTQATSAQSAGSLCDVAVEKIIEGDGQRGERKSRWKYW